MIIHSDSEARRILGFPDPATHEFHSDRLKVTEEIVLFKGIDPKPGVLDIDYLGFWNNKLFGFYDEIGQYLLTV